MLYTSENRKTISKWIIGTFTSCILIYLGIRHIASIADAVVWLVGLISPLVVGLILSLILNVPMSAIEDCLSKTKLKKGIRPLSIFLSLLLVIGIIVGVAVLVIPELIGAVRLIIQIATQVLDQMASLETDPSVLNTQWGQVLSKLDIDWIGLKSRLENWFSSQSRSIMNFAVSAIEIVASKIFSLFLSVVFAINILANKETLKRQLGRLIRVWIPSHIGENMVYVFDVCNQTFKLFIAGQATEAVILGVLCMIGMMILRIPYAPMVGALIGVTALIPILGAFIGTIIGAIMILTVNPFKAVIFVVFLLILQQIEGNLIYPRVVGSKINLPAMWVLAAVTVGGNLAGPLGMLLGVPAASAAYALIKEATDNREQIQSL